MDEVYCLVLLNMNPIIQLTVMRILKAVLKLMNPTYFLKKVEEISIINKKWRGKIRFRNLKQIQKYQIKFLELD